jgi:MHS family alpha-ketoglutarate permease-like MFS transporter
VAFAASFILGRQAMMDWGWRVPFILGGVAGFIVFYIRRSMPDTGASIAGAKAPESTGKVWHALGVHWLGFLAIITMVGATQIVNYAWLVGLPNLANSVYKEVPSQVFAVTTLLGVLLVVAGPISGWLADRYGPSRIYLTLRTIQIPAWLLILAYSGPGIGTLAAVTFFGGAILALNQVLFNYLTGTLMPPECRTTGIAVGYGIGVSVFGGTASYLLIWFQQQQALWLFVAYGMVMAAISVLVYWWAMRRGEVHADAQ